MYQEVCNYQVLNMYQGCVLLGKYSLQYVPTTEHVPGLYARKAYCTRQPYQCTVPYRTKNRTVPEKRTNVPYRTLFPSTPLGWYGSLVRYGTVRWYGFLVRYSSLHWYVFLVRYNSSLVRYGTVPSYGCLVRYLGFSGTLVRHNMIHWHSVTDLY